MLQALGGYFLWRYFYENTTHYKTIRLYILQNETETWIPPVISKQTKDILYEINYKTDNLTFINRLENDMQSIPLPLSLFWKKFIYIRYHIVLICIGLDLMIYLNREKYLIEFYGIGVPLIFVVIPTIILYFYALNIYKFEDNSVLEYTDYTKYNRKYHIMFWLILLIIKIPILWIFFFKSSIFWIMNGMLFSWDGIKVSYIYNTEDKRVFLEEYLKVYLSEENMKYYDEIFNRIAANIEHFTILDMIKDAVKATENLVIEGGGLLLLYLTQY